MKADNFEEQRRISRIILGKTENSLLPRPFLYGFGTEKTPMKVGMLLNHDRS